MDMKKRIAQTNLISIMAGSMRMDMTFSDRGGELLSAEHRISMLLFCHIETQE